MSQMEREQPDWTGRMLGRYRLFGRLGSGGMGVVYEAEDTVLERRVAIKTLPFLHVATAADRERLIGEARAAARISHPHVVTIYDVESCGEIDFLVMELLPLGSLGQRLAEHGPLPWRLATLAGLRRPGSSARRGNRAPRHQAFEPADRFGSIRLAKTRRLAGR